jgi:hypothetical protein
VTSSEAARGVVIAVVDVGLDMMVVSSTICLSCVLATRCCNPTNRFKIKSRFFLSDFLSDFFSGTILLPDKKPEKRKKENGTQLLIVMLA